MHKKSNSFFERQRKPLSRILAGLLLSLAIIAAPVGLSTVRYELWEMLGFLFLIIAAMGRIWCSIYISGRKNRELCMAGPYSLCRNPLYLFSFIGVIGFFMALQSFIIGGVAALLYLLYYRGVIISEEKRLRYLFGSSFAAYIENTPRFFPYLRGITTIDQLTVSPRIIERGLREVVWFLLAIVGVEMIELIHQQGYLAYLKLPV